LNQYVSDDSGFSVYYYKGIIPFGDTATDPAHPYTANNFTRLAVYANWYVMPKKVNLLAGWLSGNDKLDDPTLIGYMRNGTTVNGADVGKSSGYYVEADYFTDGNLAFGVRHDAFDPSANVDHNTQTANSIFMNYHPVANLQFIADYVRKVTEAGATAGNNTDNQILGRMIFIF
jgi:hypothetical protein